MRNEEQLAALLVKIRAAQSVCLICHVSPDGDTLGSALALRLRLMRMGKSVSVAVDGDVPETYKFLPDWQCVRAPSDAPPCSLAICVDVSDEPRMGAMNEYFHAAPDTALIDHHPTNDGFARLNVIDGDAPAAAVIVWRLLTLEGSPMSGDEAVCLYTALSTDTGNFVYESTDAESFAMMGELMRAGLDLSHYSRLLFRRKSLLFVRLLGMTLPSMRLTSNGRVAGLVVSAAQLAEAGATAEHTDGLVDYAIDLEGVEAAYFLREDAVGKVKASLRALAPHRVDALASSFGGGGHTLAAGCTLGMSLDEAREAIEQGLATAVGGDNA